MTQRRRVLLVYPPITKLERYGTALGAAGGQQIPLGLYYVAAFARDRGFEIDAIDAEAEGLDTEEIIARMHRREYGVLGISTTTVAFHRACELAKAAKDALPGITIVVGGPHVSAQPEAALRFPAFDYAVRNEGEETFVELLEAVFGTERQVEHIRGLLYRRDDEIVVNPVRPYIADLDSLPLPAYDLIPNLKRYNPPPCNYKKSPVANIITSRGCPNQCTFCDNNTFGRKVRLRSAQSIVGEIELLRESYNVQEIAFVDDTFTVRPTRIYEIFDLARARGLRFPWTCMARVNTVNEDLLRYMKENGCWHISFGIESGDPAVLEHIQKHISLDNVEHVIDTCHRLKILTKGFFMVGNPTDTPETIDRTIAFATRIKLDDVVVTINTPMPGSLQYERAHQYGVLDTTDWSLFNYHHPVFVPSGLTRDDLISKYRAFYRSFYLRPRIIWRYFWRLLNPTGLKRMPRLLWASRFLFQKRAGTRARRTIEPNPQAGVLEHNSKGTLGVVRYS